jgi:hypothetical protein
MRYLERCGHLNLADGSVLRLDFECQMWCASWYKPGPDHLELHAHAYGSFDAMTDLLAHWTDAFELSLTSPLSVGDDAGSGADIPAPGQTLLGETTLEETA